MYPTRKLLLSSTIQKYNHGVMKLPPRSNWDTLQSAVQGVFSLFLHPTNRNTFVQTIDKGIINPNVLGQMEFGVFMSFALHHDLNSNSSVFQKYEFDALEFIEGSQGAMETFQETLYALDKKIIGNIDEEMIKRQQEDQYLDSAGDSDDNDNGLDGNNPQEMERSLEKEMMEFDHKKKFIEELLEEQMKLKSVAQEEDADSIEYQLKQMVSKQFLDAIESQFVTSVVQCYLSDMFRMDYKLDSGKVLNVALMSARAHEVPPDENEEHSENKTKPKEETEMMIDESFSNDDNEEDYPVVAQIEVLYTLSQTFTRKKIGETSSCIMEADSETERDEEYENGMEDENRRERTMETAWVGVFEGWLNGKEPLRWKLVDNRPAWEFPMMGMGER